MDMPVEAFTVPGNKVPFIYWKLGCTAAAEWDEAASKGGNILEHLPKNRRPWFAPDPELTILTGMDAMSSASSLFLDGQSGEESVSSLPATSRIHPDGFHGRTPISERFRRSNRSANHQNYHDRASKAFRSKVRPLW
jgi:hypothetical protein